MYQHYSLRVFRDYCNFIVYFTFLMKLVLAERKIR